MFDVAFSEPLMPVAFSTAQSFSGGNELAPGVVPIEPLMIVSPASITISDATEHASSPPKAKKPRQAKQQRQQQQTQNKGQGSRRPSQEPLQTSKAVKAEVEVQDGEDVEVETEGDEETTRDQFLARNRLAASKSRRRKREWEKNLEARMLEAEQRNLNLKMERTLLIENVGHLQNQIFSHGLCKDANIDKWLQNRAYRLANNPKEQHDGLPLGDAVLSYNT